MRSVYLPQQHSNFKKIPRLLVRRIGEHSARSSTTLSATSTTNISNNSNTRSIVIPATNISLRDRHRIFSSLATTPPTNEIDIYQQAGVERQRVDVLASRRPTPLRLADLYKYGTGTDLQQRLRNAQFLHKELQIRCAQRAVDLLTLPHGLSEAAPIRQVASVYLGYLKRFNDIKLPETYEEENEFTEFLASLVLDRTTIPMNIARGVLDWRSGHHKTTTTHDDDDDDESNNMSRLQEMEDALYRFFTARVGLRFLVEHHVLSSPLEECAHNLRKSTFLLEPQACDQIKGSIQTNCDVVTEVRRISQLVSQHAKDYYGISPEIEIVDAIQKDESRAFTYVSYHLHYMVGELLKNSCRATIKRYFDEEIKGKKTELGKIRVVIVKGDEDVTIKVADKGGGIPRSLTTTIFKFAHSTADEAEADTEFGTDSVSGARIRGFGLPLARIYARYFGGELTLKSMEGYGLDAYLHLPRLGDACEHLPVRVRSSPGELDSTPSSRIRSFSSWARPNES